ncbi:MAG: Dolichol-phosphate mannosyltransferase-like protein, partial [Myxococcales bacterium]|nr:Dolichol-phosphate mannosyltransferase-like protein [Myxococcales bacterium]
MKASVPTISVILPTYNERDNVVPLARAIAEELAGREFEVLVVDDNSPDG